MTSSQGCRRSNASCSFRIKELPRDIPAIGDVAFSSTASMIRMCLLALFSTFYGPRGKGVPAFSPAAPRGSTGALQVRPKRSVPIPCATVPNSVPTPCMEALRTVASGTHEMQKSMKTSNIWESRATGVPSAKLLILSVFTMCNQRVGVQAPPPAPTSECECPISPSMCSHAKLSRAEPCASICHAALR